MLKHYDLCLVLFCRQKVIQQLFGPESDVGSVGARIAGESFRIGNSLINDYLDLSFRVIEYTHYGSLSRVRPIKVSISSADAKDTLGVLIIDAKSFA